MKASAICNPAWEIWCRIYGPDPRDFSSYNYDRMGRDLESLRSESEGRRAELSTYALRAIMIDHFGFAVPAPHLLDLVAHHGPIVEIGAGNGYWAWCLRQMGVDVIAYDAFPPQTHPFLPNVGFQEVGRKRNIWFDNYWTPVKRGYASFAKRHPDRSLLLIWPWMNDMAVEAVWAYTGSTVIYVGEERAACANDAFFDLLEREWRKVTVRLVPQWPGIHDELWVLKRK